MDPDVAHDPVYADLAAQLERSSRKLREAVAAMRSFYLTHHKKPHDENTSERWRGALLSEAACDLHQKVQEAAAQLLRYAFEIAPHSNNGLHLEEIMLLKAAHRERLERRTGYGRKEPHPRGIEEKVDVDGGPPLTLVIDPQHWEHTQRAARIRERKAQAEEPAMDSDSDSPSIEPEQVD
jgi:hypothetical protein